MNELVIRVMLEGERMVGVTAGTMATMMAQIAEMDQSLFADLTPREFDVLEYLAAGYTNQEISEAMGLSIHTVKTLISRVSESVGHGSSRRLIALAFMSGKVSPQRIIEIWKDARLIAGGNAWLRQPTKQPSK